MRKLILGILSVLLVSSISTTVYASEVADGDSLGDSSIKLGTPTNEEVNVLVEVEDGFPLENSNERSGLITEETIALNNIDSIKGKAKSFLLPVKSDRITADFGARLHPILGKKLQHNGVDFAVPVGQDILASKNGVAEFSGFKNGYGLVVIIDHQDGYKTLYAHNSKLLVEQGQKVNASDVIAKAGSTGNSTGPHLHFEILKNGKYVNPMNLLVAK